MRFVNNSKNKLNKNKWIKIIFTKQRQSYGLWVRKEKDI